jgi:glycogen(starch) synthase
VERVYADADVYVLPSVSEPFGITPLEAASRDVPVILSRQSGVSEVLTGALVIDSWDVEDLANKILAVLRRPALRAELIERGREDARRLTWERQAEVLRGVYEGTIA